MLRKHFSTQSDDHGMYLGMHLSMYQCCLISFPSRQGWSWRLTTVPEAAPYWTSTITILLETTMGPGPSNRHTEHGQCQSVASVYPGFMEWQTDFLTVVALPEADRWLSVFTSFSLIWISGWWYGQGIMSSFGAGADRLIPYVLASLVSHVDITGSVR